MESGARLERFHMAPLITALIDTYNHERYIEQALVSVLEQGLSPSELEIVVVDDGSTDQTPALIHKFVPRVKHIRKRNGGQASAFNIGFAESSGQIVALLDGDDWWAKGKLTAVANALESNPHVGAVGHGHYRAVEGSSREGELSAVVPAAQMLVNLATPVAVRSWVYCLMGALTLRRKVFEWILPIPENMIFMADSALQAAATVFGTLVLPEALFYYRCHSENLYAFDRRTAKSSAAGPKWPKSPTAAFTAAWWRSASRSLKHLNWWDISGSAPSASGCIYREARAAKRSKRRCASSAPRSRVPLLAIACLSISASARQLSPCRRAPFTAFAIGTLRKTWAAGALACSARRRHAFNLVP